MDGIRDSGEDKMTHFFSAMRFFTTLPVGNQHGFNAVGMLKHFPLVGLIIGAIVAVFDIGAVFLWNRATASVLDVALFAILTGALHIDGLGDTADGIFSHRGRERALEIMKDSRVGAMGLVTVALVLAIKCAGLMNIEHHRWLFLMIIPSYARSSPFFGFRFLTYGRPQGGLGQDFLNKNLPLSSCWGLALPVALSFLAGWGSAAVLGVGFLAVMGGILVYYKATMDCITGDMLGAMIEVLESWLFLLAGASFLG